MLRTMARQTTPDHKRKLTVAEDGRVRGAAIDRLGVDELVVTFEDDSRGRAVIRTLTVRHPGGVTVALLRQLPLLDVEHEYDRQLRASDPTQAGYMWEHQIHRQRASFALGQLRKFLAERTGPAQRRNLPTEFFELLASAYFHELASGKGTPALTIATETGTPLPTVKGWIHRARGRGYLPPARRGRAG